MSVYILMRMKSGETPYCQVPSFIRPYEIVNKNNSDSLKITKPKLTAVWMVKLITNLLQTDSVSF